MPYKWKHRYPHAAPAAPGAPGGAGAALGGNSLNHALIAEEQDGSKAIHAQKHAGI